MSDETDWARPFFRVADLSASLVYYRDKLGFTIDWIFGGPDHTSETPAGFEVPEHPVIAGVSRNGIELILDGSTDQARAVGSGVVGVELHDYEGLGSLHDLFMAAGAKISAAPFEVDWAEDTMQMNVEDLDGNRMLFWGNTRGSESRDESS